MHMLDENTSWAACNKKMASEVNLQEVGRLSSCETVNNYMQSET